MSCAEWKVGTPGGRLRGIEIVAAHHDQRHAVGPGVVDRHGAVLRPTVPWQSIICGLPEALK